MWNRGITEVKAWWSCFHAAPLVQPLLQHTASPVKEGWATPKKWHSPLTRKSLRRSEWHPSSPQRNHRVPERTTCSWRWPWDTGETENSGLYNLFDKAGEHAIHFVNSFSGSGTGEEGSSVGEHGGQVLVRTGFCLDIQVLRTSQWHKLATQGQRSECKPCCMSIISQENWGREYKPSQLHSPGVWPPRRGPSHPAAGSAWPCRNFYQDSVFRSISSAKSTEQDIASSTATSNCWHNNNNNNKTKSTLWRGGH